MPTEPTTTLTRYAVLAKADPIDRAADWAPYETPADAERARKGIARLTGASCRIVRLDITITEEAQP